MADVTFVAKVIKAKEVVDKNGSMSLSLSMQEYSYVRAKRRKLSRIWQVLVHEAEKLANILSLGDYLYVNGQLDCSVWLPDDKSIPPGVNLHVIAYNVSYLGKPPEGGAHGRREKGDNHPLEIADDHI